MTEAILSIIVPVYNAQKYLPECLESIHCQSFEAYEVLLINDGSTDESEKICEEFVKKDERFRLYSTENRGVSSARNLGIDQAKGTWLMFLDSDDYLMKDSLQALLECIREDSEELCTNYCMDENDTFTGILAEAESGDVIAVMLDSANHTMLPEFDHLESVTLQGGCGKLFRRDIILKNKIRFDEKLKLSEDTLFHVRYLNCIQKVLMYDRPVFFYRQHPASVTKSYKTEYFDNRLYLFEQLESIHMLDEVFLIMTMLLQQGSMLVGLEGLERKKFCGKFRTFWKERKSFLSAAKNKKLSVGKWQNRVYHTCVRLLLCDLYLLEEIFLYNYVRISEGRKKRQS